MTVERRNPEGVYVRKLPSIDGPIYSQVTSAIVKRSIHVSGTLPFDAHQVLVGENDVAAQTRCILEHIERSLAEFGATPADVVRTKTYVTDMASYLELGLPEWVKFFGKNPPASTTVGVTEFADSRCFVQIEAYAELDT
ncbi:RidA family protein [Streptomyces sp. JNUCC 63]